MQAMEPNKDTGKTSNNERREARAAFFAATLVSAVVIVASAIYRSADQTENQNMPQLENHHFSSDIEQDSHS